MKADRGKRLMLLINDLLDLAMLETGKLSIDLQTANLACRPSSRSSSNPAQRDVDEHTVRFTLELPSTDPAGAPEPEHGSELEPSL